MAEGADQPKRARGRPRLPVEDKKRRNMTFRVRDELRDAVEELATANGRSLSEQVEYYVERGVGSDASYAYQYDSSSVSPALFKWLTGIDKKNGAEIIDSDLTENQKTDSQSDIFELSPQAQASLGRAFNAVMHDVMISSMPGKISLSDMKDLERYREIMDKKYSDPKIFEKHPRDAPPAQISIADAQASIAELEQELSFRRTEREQMLEDKLALARSENEALRRLIPKSALDTAGRVSATVKDAHKSLYGETFTIEAMREWLGSLKHAEVNLNELRSSGWPQQFKDLPADTQSTLIGLLRSGASEAYDALMAPRGLRREALNALRRLRDAILGRHEEDEGPVDDLGGL